MNINFAILLILFSFCSNIVLGQYTPAMPSIDAGWGSSGNAPFGGNTTAYSDLKDQYILLATDLTAGGMITNDVLTCLGFYISGGTTKTFNGLTIYLKHTAASTISTFDNTGLTLVYQANPTLTNTAGWKNFSFTSGFTWNGTNNILISICWNNSSASLGLTNHYSLTSYPTGPNREVMRKETSGSGCSWTYSPTGGSFTAPFTRFGIQPKITSFTPAGICASSNQIVIITGKYFTGATAVLIGGTAAASFIVNSDTQITATIGAGTTGVISVAAPTGTGTSSSSITVNPKPIATATPINQTICSGLASSVSLSSNVSGTTFTWLTASNASVTGESTTAQSSSIINNTLTNATSSPITLNYTVTPTTAASGCTGTAITVPITVNPYPIATATPINQTICSGLASSVSLTSNVSGTTFTWLAASNASITGESTTAQSSSIINNTLTNSTTSPITLNYIVTPTASGCTGTSITVMITVNPKPIATATPINQTICSGILPGISFTSNISGSTFSWSTTANANIGGESSTVQTGSSITDLLTNTTASPITLNYSVTPIIAGCSGTTITVPLTVNPSVASISAGGSTTFCEGSQVLLIANSGIDLTYQWYLNSIPLSAQNNSTLVVDSTGNYNVSVLNNYNCSINSNTIQVIVNTNPQIPIISISSPTIFCLGDSVLLSTDIFISPPVNYQWMENGINISGATHPFYNGLNSAIYTLTVTSAFGCIATSEPVTLSISASPIISAGSDQDICEGDSVMLSATSSTPFIWAGSVIDSDFFFPTTSEYYSVSAVNTDGCSSVDSVFVYIHYPTNSSIYCSSYGNYFLNGTEYFESGVYIQTISNYWGCDSTIILNLKILHSGLDDLETINGIKLFPNPSLTGDFFLSYPEDCNCDKILIMDEQGKIIQEYFDKPTSFDLKGVDAGKYFVEFHCGYQRFVIQIQKVHD